MNGLNKIRDKIISEANDNAHLIIEEARAKCIALSNEYAKKAEEARADLKVKSEELANTLIERTKERAEEDRKEKLAETQKRLVDDSFVSARKSIDKLGEEKRTELLFSLARKALEQSIEENEDADTFEILLRKHDLNHYGEQLHKKLCRIIDKKYGKGKKTIMLSNVPGKIDGGVMVMCGENETDYSFSAIFDRLRIQLEREISEYLFDKK